MAVLTGMSAAQVAADKIRTDTTAEVAALEATLAATDWYVTRMAETGKELPPEVIAGRQSARNRISELRAMPMEEK